MTYSQDQETIIAQCTPQGSGAVALLRISGNNALSVAANIGVLPSNISLLNVPSHTIHYGYVVDGQGAHIDQVLFLVMHGPKTFTGQDTVEITCHNNVFLIGRIIERAIEGGARLAQSGEFSRRAFLHGKIDLLQAEAINELIQASNQQSIRQSLAQLKGSFSQWIATIENKLLNCVAFVDASFEFLDEEITFDDQIKIRFNEIMQDVEFVKQHFNQQQHLRQGIRIALIGSVNAGKSSLFNALIDQKRAIVTSIAGTTRDVIEMGVYKEGSYRTFVDTAGIRQTQDIIEQEGILKSYEEAHKADIILLIIDSSRESTKQEDEIYHNLIMKYASKIILLYNKIDSVHQTFKPLEGSVKAVVRTSSHSSLSIQGIHENIQKKIDEIVSAAEAPFLLNQRHFSILLDIETKLRDLKSLLQERVISYELVSYHLKDILERLTELTGKSISEEAMDRVFKTFCVGK